MVLYPALLWGLLALAVPVVVHLLQLQRARQLDFPQLRFLQSVQQQRQRVHSLRRWLLLALRLLAVTAVVLAAARWVWRLTTPAAGADRHLIVLDDSPSMQLPRQGVPSWQVQRRAARELLSTLPRTAEVALVTTSGMDAGAEFGPVGRALQQLDALQPSMQPTSVAAALRRMGPLAGERPTQATLFTDGQASALDDTLVPPAPVGLQLSVALLPEATANRWIGQVSLRTEAPAAGEPIELAVQVHSAGTQPEGRTALSLVLNGQPVAQSPIQWRSDTATVLLRFTPRQAGTLVGELRIDDPAAPHDNAVPLALELAPAPCVLWVEGGTPAQGLDVLRSAALPALSHRIIPGQALAQQALSAYSAVVLLDPAGTQGAGLSSGEAEALRQWVAQGGGLLLWPGPRSTAEGLTPLITALELGRISGPEVLTPPQEPSELSLSHPLLAGAFVRPGQDERLDAPQVQRRWRLTPNVNGVIDQPIRFADAVPFLAEKELESGRVALLSTYPAEGWSDWNRRSSYPALLARLINRLARSGQQSLVIDPQATPTVEFTARSTQPIELVAEGQTAQPGTIRPVQRAVTGRVRLAMDQTPLVPGTYRVLQGDSLLARMAVRTPARESDPASLSAEAMTSWLERHGWPNATVRQGSPGQLARGLGADAQSGDATQLLLLLAATLLIAELLVARYVR